jgi:hypothetical protein
MKIICYYIVFSMTERLMIMNYISNHRETIGGWFQYLFGLIRKVNYEWQYNAFSQ